MVEMDAFHSFSVSLRKEKKRILTNRHLKHLKYKTDLYEMILIELREDEAEMKKKKYS